MNAQVSAGKRTSTATSGVPPIAANSQPVRNSGHAGKWMMAACCVPMVAVAGIYLYSVGLDGNWSARIFVVAPLVLCLGVHVLMFKFMGHSCHGPKKSENDNDR